MTYYISTIQRRLLTMTNDFGAFRHSSFGNETRVLHQSKGTCSLTHSRPPTAVTTN